MAHQNIRWKQRISALLQDKKNLITLLQRVLLSEKTIPAKITYWGNASWLLPLIHLSQTLPFNLCHTELQPRLEEGFPLHECVAARQLLECVLVLDRPSPPSQGRETYLLYQNPNSFPLLCSPWHRAQFIHVHCFISNGAFIEQQ